MISHVVLSDVASERSQTLRLQADEFRQARTAVSISQPAIAWDVFMTTSARK